MDIWECLTEMRELDELAEQAKEVYRQNPNYEGDHIDALADVLRERGLVIIERKELLRLCGGI